MIFETTVAIDAPPDRVWSTLVDVERWPEFTTTISRVEHVDGKALTLGARFRIKQPRMPVLVWEVTELVPGTSFAWRAMTAGVATIGSHTIEAWGDGTKVTLGIRRFGALAPIVGALTSARTRRYVGIEASSLKERCESNQAG